MTKPEAPTTAAVGSPLDGAVRPVSVAWELALLAQTIDFSEDVRETCQRGHDELERLRTELICAQESAARWKAIAEIARTLANVSSSQKLAMHSCDDPLCAVCGNPWA